MAPQTRRVRVRVAGRVQGVFYRASCAKRARALGLNGWVRNASDGGVEAIFEGPATTVERMLEWCRDGPPHARVERLEVEDEEPLGESRFRVVR